jgi:hypothetical protein
MVGMARFQKKGAIPSSLLIWKKKKKKNLKENENKPRPRMAAFAMETSHTNHVRVGQSTGLRISGDARVMAYGGTGMG